eukprot:c5539_g1_i1.p2 GENE.c5539_g1_i1~~c5539_g1_i1.p2  ORF type:complete len:127 (+),score=19.09 c5539_g1_i1:1-381(+)
MGTLSDILYLMFVSVFAEFDGWALLQALHQEKPNIKVPTKESMSATKLLGKETADNEILRTNIKLFFTPEEEARGDVDEAIRVLERLGCELEDRNPYREASVDHKTGQVVREYCKDRAILKLKASK